MIAFLLAAIPGLSSLVGAFTTAYFNAKVRITTARIGGDTTVATQLVKSSSQDYATNADRWKTYAASKWLTLLIFLFAMPWIIMEWKVIVWDTVLDWGVTMPVKGEIGSWGHIIIISLFGSGTTLAVGHLYFDRSNK